MIETNDADPLAAARKKQTASKTHNRAEQVSVRHSSQRGEQSGICSPHPGGLRSGKQSG
jgi:hypothetical protein